MDKEEEDTEVEELEKLEETEVFGEEDERLEEGKTCLYISPEASDSAEAAAAVICATCISCPPMSANRMPSPPRCCDLQRGIRISKNFEAIEKVYT